MRQYTLYTIQQLNQCKTVLYDDDLCSWNLFERDAQQRKMAFNEGNNRLTRSGYENERRKKNYQRRQQQQRYICTNHPTKPKRFELLWLH